MSTATFLKLDFSIHHCVILVCILLHIHWQWYFSPVSLLWDLSTIIWLTFVVSFIFVISKFILFQGNLWGSWGMGIYWQLSSAVRAGFLLMLFSYFKFYFFFNDIILYLTLQDYLKNYWWELPHPFFFFLNGGISSQFIWPEIHFCCCSSWVHRHIYLKRLVNLDAALLCNKVLILLRWTLTAASDLCEDMGQLLKLEDQTLHLVWVVGGMSTWLPFCLDVASARIIKYVGIWFLKIGNPCH